MRTSRSPRTSLRLTRLRTVFTNPRTTASSSSSSSTSPLSDPTPQRTRDSSPNGSIASNNTTSSTTSSIRAILLSRHQQHQRTRSLDSELVDEDDDVVGLLEPRTWREEGVGCLGIMEVLEGR